jgi:formylmethanofuran dehydrogenase subunit E
MYNHYNSPQSLYTIDNNDSPVIQMDEKVKPELVLIRKVCDSCGEKNFELASEIQVSGKYICLDCLT